MKARFYPPAPMAVAPAPVEIDFFYVVYLGQYSWKVVEPDDGRPIHYRYSHFTSFDDVMSYQPGAIPVMMDALAAIAAGMIQPSELRYPETLVAAISLCNS